MAFQKSALAGYPAGADEAAPGSIVNARNLCIPKTGVIARRGPVHDLNLNDPCAQIRGIASSLSGPWFAWEDPTTGHIRIGSSWVYGAIANSIDLGANAAPPAGFASIPLPDGAGEIFPVCPPRVVAADPGAGYAYGPFMTSWRLGCPRAQDITLTAELSVSSVLGANAPTVGFNPGDIAAYRAVLSYDRTTVQTSFGTPVNNVINVVGGTGGRFIYARPTTGGGVTVPTLRVRLPKNLTQFTTPNANALTGVPPYTYTAPLAFTTYLTIYRSVPILTAAARAATGAVWNATPVDSMLEVFRTIVTSTDISNGYIEFTDTCPFGSEGASLYTNATADGSAQDAWLPPFAVSSAQFKGTLFWGAPQDMILRTTMFVSGPPPVFKGTIAVVSGVAQIPMPSGITAVSLLAGQYISFFGAAGLTGDYQVAGATLVGSSLHVTFSGSAPTNNAGYTNCFATWGRITVNGAYNLDLSLNCSANGAANKILVRLPLDGSGNLTVPSQAYTQQFAGDLATAINISCNPSASPTITASVNASGNLANASIMLEYEAGSAANLSGYFTVTVAGIPRSFESLSGVISPIQPATSLPQINGLWWSPWNIYDNACPQFQLTIGSPHGTVLKLVATKDALYIFKTDGIWILTGDSPFITPPITLLSDSVVALSATAIDVFEDTVYAATNIGIISITGASIAVVSGDVQTEYQDAIASIGGIGHTVLATSYQDFTLRLGIPVGGSGVATCVTFVYSFTSGQWLVGHEAGLNRYISNTYIGSQSETPLSTRYAFKLGGPTGLVIRAPCAYGTPYLCSSAVEGNNGSLPFLTQANGESRPSTDDTQNITLVYDGTLGHYHFVGPLANPDANLNNAGIWFSGYFQKLTNVVYTADSTPEVKITCIIPEAVAGGYAGFRTLYIPIDVSITLAPIGDGTAAYNFNQIGILQTRRSSAKQLTFNFWLDTTNSYPYVAPVVSTLSNLVPDSLARNVVRSSVPAAVTRGSRLNIQILAGTTPEERCEFSQLLLDITPIAGEEVQY